MKNKRMNDKGFSLVELIVVIAIMAILAVTFAPKLMHYVDKAKKSSDQEVANSIYTAVNYALLDSTSAEISALLSSGSVSLIGYDAASPYNLNANGMYKLVSGKWTFNDSYTLASNKLVKEIKSVVGDFKLKYSETSGKPQIVIKGSTADTLEVYLYYDKYNGDGTGTDYDYKVSASEVR